MSIDKLLPDEPAYDWTRHVERVQKLYEQYPLKTYEQCQEIVYELFLGVCEKFGHVPNDAISQHICDAIIALYIENDICRTSLLPVWLGESPGREMIETYIEPRLSRLEKVLSHPAELLKTAALGIESLIVLLLPLFPEDALSEDDSEPLMRFALLDRAPDPKPLIDQLLNFFSSNTFLEDFETYPKTAITLARNARAASGISEDDPRRFTKKMLPAEDADGAPYEVAECYLQNTPLLDILMTPIGFDFDTASRLEHWHLIGGSGHGKTQTLQSIIVRDLESSDPPALVIIDSQGEMLSKLQRLAIFNGRLKDRLIIIDPEYSPALNMFSSPKRSYTGILKEQMEAGIIELYTYIFSALDADLSSKMGTAFSYVVRLVSSIEGATIHTLREILEEAIKPGQESRFAPQIAQLDPTAQAFFANQFHQQGYRVSKEALSRRLYSVLSIPAFDRMFSASENRLDMYEAIQGGKIVLVNTNKALLKKDASALFGRYMIAQTLAAAFERVAGTANKPAYLIVDEAADYFSGGDDKLEELLSQARKFRLGILFAHQSMHQLGGKLQHAIASNTTIKMAGGISTADARVLAPDMHTTFDFITGMQKKRSSTEWACYVRNKTMSAVRLDIKFGALESAPQMTDAEHAAMIERNRERYSAQLVTPEATVAAPVTEPPQAAPPPPTEPNSPNPGKEW